MRRIARRTFLALEKAWQLEGGTLVDLKVEFGFDSKGHLLLADVIDNDSWRVADRFGSALCAFRPHAGVELVNHPRP